MDSYKRYLITSALPYANGLKHIGHLAGAYIPADIYVRYLRAQKRDVVYVCGSDEHGTAIPIQAKQENTTPQAIIDKYHAILQQNFADLGISFDIYHRTSSALHHQTSTEFFEAMLQSNQLAVKTSDQYFDEQEQMFLADRYIKGTCPNCAHPQAYGDQCEKCGKSLSPDDLINPVSTLSGKKPIKKQTQHWYLPLQEHEAFLRNWLLTQHQHDWKANVLGQCKSWLDGGLQPRAVTRDLDWGVKVPNHEGKVLYVWFDAPVGYISATKQWALDHNKDWKPYWYNHDTKLVHFIGKDNIVFHCIIFPVMLQQQGFILPTQVPANEFMNLEGDKMSTSRGWSIEMEEFIQDWINTPQGKQPIMADVLRYYLTSIMPENKDSEFTWKGFQDANNSELVSILGNYINRTMVLMHKLCAGKVPAFHVEQADDKDEAIKQSLQKTVETVTQHLENYKFRDALFTVMDLARQCNRYMQEKEPWIWAKTIQENPHHQLIIDNCLHICLQMAANLAILIHPFMPNAAEKLCYQFKVVPKMLEWENAGKMNLLSVGYMLRAPELLFRKIEDEEIARQIEKLKQKSKPMQAEPIIEQQAEQPKVKDTIQFDDFAKIDLRAGKIIAAEKVEKADKLLKLTVDLGFEERTIVSGIALHFKPEEVVGKMVSVVVNLAARKMRGIESNGMILMAEDAEGKLHFVRPESDIASGSSIS